MTVIFYLLGYLAIIGFACLAVSKLKGYLQASPLHVRWELYPVPHEGHKASYGGSFMEEKEWWTRPRHVSHLGDICGMLCEILFLHATLKHNPKLWFRTYPFHVGMYMLMGGTIILVVATLAAMCDPSLMYIDKGNVIYANAFVHFVANLINVMVAIGSVCIVAGGIALIQRRMTDQGLKKYTTNEHYLNLGAFVVFGALTALTWASSPSYCALAYEFLCNMFTLSMGTPLSDTLFTWNMLAGFFVLILIPLTNMQHLILKYHMYHDIRWGDEPTSYSEKNQKTINEMLTYKPTWSASHIAGDGSRTWVDVATTNPTAPKE